MPFARAVRSPAVAAGAASVACAMALLWPLVSPGFVLVRDMVFTPAPPFSAADWGISTALPRAVPSDAIAGAISAVVGGQLAQRLVLVFIVCFAGLGSGMLARRVVCAAFDEISPGSAIAALASATAALGYVWNPYLVERLLLGQWAVLLGFAALPWVVLTAADLGDSTRSDRGVARFMLTICVASCGGAPAWLLVAPSVVLACVTRPGATWSRGRSVAISGVVLACTAVWWLVPALVRPGGVSADRLGSRVFSLRSDTVLGLVLSAVTGGGVWNRDAVPVGRGSVAAGLTALLLAALGVSGWLAVRRADRRVMMPLAGAAALGLSLAFVSATTPGEHLTGVMPGGAILRDSTRLLAPWVLAVSLGIAVTVARIARLGWRPLAVLAALVPVAALPGAALRLGGGLHAVQFPHDYGVVASAVNADRASGAVLVLPADGYRSYRWNGSTPVRQPLTRWVGRPVVISDDLTVVSGGEPLTVTGEDRYAADVLAGLRNATSPTDVPAVLARFGIRFVVVDGPESTELGGLTPLVRGPDLALYRVEGPISTLTAARGPYLPDIRTVVIADTASFLLLVSAFTIALLWKRPMLALKAEQPDTPDVRGA